jgi:hypothetical protein
LDATVAGGGTGRRGCVCGGGPLIHVVHA